MKDAGDLFEGDIVERPVPSLRGRQRRRRPADVQGVDGRGRPRARDRLRHKGYSARTAYDGILAAGPQFDRAKVVAASTNAHRLHRRRHDAAATGRPPTPARRPGSKVDPASCMAFFKVENGAFVMRRRPGQAVDCCCRWPPGLTRTPRSRTSSSRPTDVLAARTVEDLFRAVLQGAPPGTVYALVALGFVLAYKTSGIFNLAFGAQAYVSAVVFFKTHTEWGWPILPAFLVSVVVLAPPVGVLLEWLVFRHLRTRRRSPASWWPSA